VFIVTMNPDGRVNATRANTNGFDMNRDHITQSQPEVRIFRDNLIRYDPLTFLDQHGYVQFTLIEPTTGPHGENYEYDLYIPNAIRNALAMEEAVLATGEPNRVVGTKFVTGFDRIDIPFRNNVSTAGTTGRRSSPRCTRCTTGSSATRSSSRTTREGSPTWRTATSARASTPPSRARRSRRTSRGRTRTGCRSSPTSSSCTAVGSTVSPRVRSTTRELAELSLAAGDNARDVPARLPAGVRDPRRRDQRSDTAAARLAQHLIDNDVTVHQARVPVTIGGTRYAAGSYVVDMHQAKRGLANTMLDIGRDVSQNFPTMYDISAWSHAACGARPSTGSRTPTSTRVSSSRSRRSRAPAASPRATARPTA
jgi:hypothetical protein